MCSEGPYVDLHQQGDNKTKNMAVFLVANFLTRTVISTLKQLPKTFILQTLWSITTFYSCFLFQRLTNWTWAQHRFNLHFRVFATTWIGGTWPRQPASIKCEQNCVFTRSECKQIATFQFEAAVRVKLNLETLTLIPRPQS